MAKYLKFLTKLAASSNLLVPTKALRGLAVPMKYLALPEYVDWSYCGLDKSILGKELEGCMEY